MFNLFVADRIFVRLKQVKLSGFKSFVDPTSFDLPGELVGIVGPNGCGKSNIIDAIRWVLGESRAGELRGDSMQDVIFSGSDTRRPAARASVELVFENCAGRLGGQWGTYAELSVRRVLGRDGQSTYQLNQQTVRRRDVHDVFLGTGLGSRAYAIIGQGMIARILEAKPEELRGFLEEAAGVSRYRDRRKQTESRLADTRENLLRINDLKQELENQIERLDRQAAVAQRLRRLEADRSDKQILLRLLTRDEAIVRHASLAENLDQFRAQFEQVQQALREVQARLETMRESHLSASDQINAAQGALYEASAEFSAVESQARRIATDRAEVSQRLTGAQQSRELAMAQLARAEEERASAALAGQNAQAKTQELQARFATTQEATGLAERALWTARQTLERTRESLADSQRELEVAQAKAKAARERVTAAHSRAQRRRTELAALSGPTQEQVAAAIELASATRQAEGEASAQQAALESAAREAALLRDQAHQSLRQAQTRAAELDGRLAALRQLQARVGASRQLAPWLAQSGLQEATPLWQSLQIAAGWEVAVESVLRERVAALAALPNTPLHNVVQQAPPSRLTLILTPNLPEEQSVAASAPQRAVRPAQAKPLRDLVEVTQPHLQPVLSEWLDGIWIAEDLATALSHRALLAPGERWITAQGHQVGPSSLQFHHANSEQDGLLARQQEIRSLEQNLVVQTQLVQQSSIAAREADAHYSAVSKALDSGREVLRRAVHAAGAAGNESERLTQTRARVQTTQEGITLELAELESENAEQTRLAESLEAQGQGLRASFSHYQALQTEQRAAIGEFETAVQQARQAQRSFEQAQQEAAYALREAQSREHRAQDQITSAQADGQRATELIAHQSALLVTLAQQDCTAQLAQAKAIRDEREASLLTLRGAAEAVSLELRQTDTLRVERERALDALRGHLQQLQLDEQAARLMVEQLATQLAESIAQADQPAPTADHEAASSPGEGGAVFDLAALRARFNPPPPIDSLQQEVTRLTRAIAALGPVNLAALDELHQARERQEFLDAQLADLTEAMQTLEGAIRSIDRESRELLKETFERVNGHFGTLFPQLFGGGEAKLVLTGDEILDAGLHVSAQPPGKRTSSIQMLSGGEKALTATALVFAFFSLNPAPFCLLDEVDAPLDDANTERFCRMVRSMSSQTQFVFITHNRIAMEYAEQLIGVTMQERGVSRLVAVDLEAAGALAEAA